MAEHHTQGRIRYEHKSGVCPELISERGELIAVFAVEPTEPDRYRLVSSWNALLGMDAGLIGNICLTSGSVTIRMLEQKAWIDRLEADNTSLRGLLAAALEAEVSANANVSDLLDAAEKALEECCDLLQTEAGNALESAIKKAKGLAG